MSNRIYVMLGLAILLLGGCAVSESSLKTSSPEEAPASLNLPALGELDELRAAQTAELLPLEPGSFVASAGSVALLGDDLKLDGTTGQPAWALYTYPVENKTLFNLIVKFSAAGGSGPWLGVANYTSGRWEFGAQLSSSPHNKPIGSSTGQDYISPAGNLHFCIACQTGDNLLLTDLNILADVPPPPTYVVSGTVTDQNLQPVKDVTVTLGPVGGQVLTDASGVYLFPTVPPDEYLITAARNGYTFDPPGWVINVINADITGMDFEATGTPPPTYSVSGTVLDGSLSPLADVLLTLNPGGLTQLSGPTGTFSFDEIEAGNYTLSPSKTDFSFVPASRNVNVIDNNITGQDFTGNDSTGFSISGTVKDNLDVALSGVTLTLIPGGKQATTDALGFYIINGVSPGPYDLSPAKVGYTFDPTNLTEIVTDADIVDQDFSGTPDAAGISYEDDLLPIINGSMGSQYSCLPCHAGSFPQNGLDMTDYNDVVAFSASINDRINRTQGSPGFMPNGKTKWQSQWLQDFQDWIDGGFQP